MKEKNIKRYMSSDEIVEWARIYSNFDSVIIKNVREGILHDLPIYDVIIWSEENLKSYKDVTNNTIDSFRKYTEKRIDLSMYTFEKDYDGIVDIIYYQGYCIENRIVLEKDYFVIDSVLVIDTSSSVEIYCYDIDDYVKVVNNEKNSYDIELMFGKQLILPINERIEIHNWDRNIYKNILITVVD